MKPCFALLLTLVLSSGGCAAMAEQPLRTAADLEIDRFMGRWYVIASIPTPFERDAFNAIEDYVWLGDGKVDTRFTYNKGSLDGPLKVTNTTGYVSAEDAAIWGMQFVWPFKADYRIAHVDDAYSVTIVAREKRDFVWLMSRSSQMSEADYAGYVEQIAGLGYDVSRLVRIQHGEPAAIASTAGEE